MPRDVLRAQLRSAALALLAAGERVTVQRLREHGVRGGTAVLIQLREELVAAGELPPEAAARVYAPPKHPPGRSVVRGAISSGAVSSGAISDQQSAVSLRAVSHQELLGPRNGDAEELKADRSRASRAQRRSQRLVRQYNSAVRNVFGRARARQIGAAP